MKKATKEAQLRKKEQEAVKKVKKEEIESSNWREELKEIIDMPSTGLKPRKRPRTDVKSQEKITEKPINNKVIINPTVGQVMASFDHELQSMGGQLLEVLEVREAITDQVPPSPQELLIQKRMANLNMRLARKNREKLGKIKKTDLDTSKKGVKEELSDRAKKEVERDAKNVDNPLYKPGRRTVKQLAYARELALKKKKVVGESRDSAGGDLDKEPPSWASMNPEDRGNPAYMKTSSLKDEEKWKRLQRMRKASKKKEVRAKANEEVQAELQEKDTYDQVAAVIDKDRAKKGTDYATYDSMHGKKKAAKRERDYAAFERKKMKRDAQRSGHPWEHAKGSTTEKEGKPSEKTKHVRDPQYNSYEPKGGVIAEKDLDAAERRALPDKDFALPGKGKGPQGKQAGSYPIPDKTHARMALAMVAKHGTSEEKAKVRAAVEKKFPGIKVSEEVQQLVNSERFSQEEILRLISD